MINNFSKELLKDLEISAVGDIYAILKHAKEVGAQVVYFYFILRILILVKVFIYKRKCIHC